MRKPRCLKDEVKHRKTDSEIKTKIEKLMSGEPSGRLQGMEKGKRNEILRKIKGIDDVVFVNSKLGQKAIEF